MVLVPKILAQMAIVAAGLIFMDKQRIPVVATLVIVQQSNSNTVRRYVVIKLVLMALMVTVLVATAQTVMEQKVMALWCN